MHRVGGLTSGGREGRRLPGLRAAGEEGERECDGDEAITDGETREKTLSSGFAAKVDELRKPDWEKVEKIVSDSDSAGKSAGFADTQGEAAAIKSFMESEKTELNNRIAGNVAHAAKQAGCTGDQIGGQMAYAMNDAVSKQMQKKLRSRNEAFVTIERYKTSLGPQNVASLEKLADEVSEASYIVHVQMILQKERLKKLASDKSDVKRTLDRFIEDETAFQNEPGRTDGEKRASQDRIKDANKSKAEIDQLGEQASAVSNEADKRVEAATKEYEEALKALKTKIEEKKKAEPTNKDEKRPAAAPAAAKPATPKTDAPKADAPKDPSEPVP